MTSQLPPLSDSLPMQLLKVREVIMQRLRAHMSAHDLTDQQWRVLRVLAEAEIVDMQTLAQGACIRSPSLSRIVPKLEARGLVRRETNGADRRQTFVELTQTGRTMLDRIGPAIAGSLADLELDVGTPFLDDLRSGLRGTLEALGGPNMDAGNGNGDS